MTPLDAHAANRPHPTGSDSTDSYVRNGHALRARGAREGFEVIWRMLPSLAGR